MKTNTISTILIDDEPDARAVLRRLIGRYCPMLDVRAEVGSVAAGLEAIQLHQPGLVFLDINLNGASGFDLLKAFPNPGFRIVFVTAHDEYAVEAFKVRALHYLLKPIDPADLIAVTNELILQLGGASAAVGVDGRENGLLLPTTKGTVLIRQEEICYIQSNDKYATLVLLDGETVFIGRSLKEIESDLTTGAFIRPHQSYIVRIASIRKIVTAGGLTLILKDNTTIPVSRRNREAVLRVLGMA
ncbi:MAG: LytTR family DNA-binding domain-containing protein [Saprospiraceae bacterium]|nr:response regulator transcription factor [Lewinellaceae bacterium]